MQALVHYTLGGALVGVGATAVVDFWSIGRKHVFGISAPEYGLLGRWLAHMPDGRFRSYTRPESVGDARFPARAREALAQCAGIATRELDGVALLGCLQFERHSGSRETTRSKNRSRKQQMESEISERRNAIGQSLT